MIERLRSLSPSLRFAVYIVGGLLLFSLAVGMGAMAGLVVGPQFGAFPAGSAETGTPEGGKPETTSVAGALEDTAIEPSSESDSSNDTANEVSLAHQATDKNSRGDFTYISDPVINGDSDAVVLVSDPENLGSTSYEHNIGVWYEGVARKWAIFNQDLAPVPAGATFRVFVPEESARFVHRATLLNTAGNYTYLDNQLTNGQPDAVLSVTQSWNPGGGRGVYNNHPIGTQYDAQSKKWAVYNKDGATIPKGAAFNVAVSTGTDQGVR